MLAEDVCVYICVSTGSNDTNILVWSPQISRGSKRQREREEKGEGEEKEEGARAGREGSFPLGGDDDDGDAWSDDDVLAGAGALGGEVDQEAGEETQSQDTLDAALALQLQLPLQRRQEQRLAMQGLQLPYWYGVDPQEHKRENG